MSSDICDGKSYWDLFCITNYTFTSKPKSEPQRMACVLKNTACFYVIFIALFSQVEATKWSKCSDGGFYCVDDLHYCCFKNYLCRPDCIGEPCTSSIATVRQANIVVMKHVP